MLDLNEKIRIFENILNQEEINYSDTFNSYIELMSENYNYSFLNNLKSKKEIKYWISKLKSRIVMREDDDILEEIISDYILCG